jgi:hypothetical protein
MKYRIHYMNAEGWRRDFGYGGNIPDCRKLAETHTELRTIEARDLDDVYYQSQGEIWSPNGEARSLIEAKGLRHTSMSKGDVIECLDTGRFYMVAGIGFTMIAARRGDNIIVKRMPLVFRDRNTRKEV